MDFDFSPAVLALQTRVKQFALKVVAPRAAAMDRQGRTAEEVRTAFLELGLFGAGYPAQYEGGGLGLTGLCAAVEEVAKYCCSCGVWLLLSRLPGAPFLYGGSPEQKQKYLGGLAAGRLAGAFANTEPEAGSDSAAIRTRAQKDGTGYVLTGVKSFVWGAPLADFFVVSAKTDPQAGHRGVSVFVVDKGAPGLAVGRSEPTMGVRAVPVSQLVLADCRVPAENLLGRENEGFGLLMHALNSVRPVVAALGLGLAQGALQYALDYARQRQAFGQPVARFQGTRWKVATLATEIEAARWLVYHGASLVDRGLVDLAHAPYLAMAKLFASELAVRAADAAVQMLGANGYSRNYPVERFYRDAKQLTIVEGTSEIQLEIIGRAVVSGAVSYR